MADNFLKLWLQQNLNTLATNRALAEIERTGRALPCSVIAVNPNGLGTSIVMVKFEVQNAPWTLPPLILPKAESQWLRAPTQVGDFGVTVPADTYLGAISGFDNSVADMTVDYGNMTTLVWVPIASKAFGAPPDQNKAWANGPAGAVLSDTEQTVVFDADNASGNAKVDAANDVLLQGSTGASTDGIVRQSDLQAAINATIATIVAWTNANFHSGSNSAAAPADPTATSSDKSFTG